MTDSFIPCDRCGMRAYYHVVIDNGLPLSFCKHHADTYEEALFAYAIQTDDQRAQLYQEA